MLIDDPSPAASTSPIDVHQPGRVPAVVASRQRRPPPHRWKRGPGWSTTSVGGGWEKPIPDRRRAHAVGRARSGDRGIGCSAARKPPAGTDRPRAWPATVPDDVAEQVTCDCKYAGYVARQDVEIERQRRLAEAHPQRLRLRPARAFAGRARLARIQPTSLARKAASAASRRPTWQC